jgi:hypothetical protein
VSLSAPPEGCQRVTVFPRLLKEHRKVKQQEATIIQLKSTRAQQQKDFQMTTF